MASIESAVETLVSAMETLVAGLGDIMTALLAILPTVFEVLINLAIYGALLGMIAAIVAGLAWIFNLKELMTWIKKK